MRRVCATLALFALMPAAAQQRIEDPYRAEQLDCSGLPDGPYLNAGDRFGYGRFRLRADLNFDGNEDLIVNDADAGACGTGGCGAVILLRQADGHYVRRTLWLHPAATELAKKGEGTGWLRSYWHISAREGGFVVSEIGADAIRQIQPDPAQARQSAQRPPPRKAGAKASTPALQWTPLKPEYAWCKAGALQWRDSPR